MERGKLIVFEGLDHTGKTTQILLAEKWLNEQGIANTRYREPGGTKVGERIRALLLDRDENMTFKTEMLLFFASRVQLAQEHVLDDLEEGRNVILDRYYYSTAAYQGPYMTGGIASVLAMARTLELPEPDLVLCLDGNPAELARRQQGTPDRIEAKGVEYQRNVRRAYIEICDITPNFYFVNAELHVQEVHDQVVAHLKRIFP